MMAQGTAAVTHIQIIFFSRHSVYLFTLKSIPLLRFIYLYFAIYKRSVHA